MNGFDMPRPMSAVRRALLTCTALGALAAWTAPAVAQAQAAGADRALTAPHDFDLPIQSLARSITQVASIAGLQVLYSDDMAPDARAPALSGRMSAQQALERLVAGSGYAVRVTSDRVVTLVRVSAEGNDGERVTGAVRVEGAQGSPYFGGAGQAAGVNGINGSRDITATEGTGSFTSGALTIGSKVPQAMKDVPQSVSVLTAERLEQQNVTDFTTAMRQLPGVTLVQGQTSLENTFYSRGFAITNIQVDGGAPLGTAFGGGVSFYPQIDMSIYDHVELLRGAAGLFDGYGDPSGTVNLVRKKPLDHQVTLDAQAGSWNNYRIVADATAPLALDGKLRGRLVMTYQDNHYFYDIAKDNKTLVYGVAELDATPTTLVTAGISYTRQNSLPWYGGLPRYQTGADLGLPRSTSFAFPWSRWDFDTTEIFGGIEQKIGSDWTAKINLTHNRQQSARKLGYPFASGGVNPVTNAGPLMNGDYNDYASKQFSAEALLTGAFEIFGQRQEITIGANRVDSDGGGRINYNSLFSSSASAPYQPYPGGPLFCTTVSICPSGLSYPPINVFDFDPDDPLYTEPRNPLPNNRYLNYGQVQSGAYVNLRLTAFDRLHLTTGLRWSRYKLKYSIENICATIPATDPGYSPNCFGKQIGDGYFTSSYAISDDDISWPPPVNLSFDVTRQLAAYAGYTNIYQSNVNRLDADRKPLDPVTGSNVEAGLKWSARDGRLNLSVAGYRIKQKGFWIQDSRFPSETVSPGVTCCYVNNPNRSQTSQGIDVEATGEILSGLASCGELHL